MAKKAISKKIVETKSIDLTGFLNLDELQGFTIEFEDEGQKDVTNLIKELNGEYVTISIKTKEEKVLEADEPFVAKEREKK